MAGVLSVVLIGAGCGVTSAGSDADGDTFELRFASYISDAAPQSRSMQWWAEQVEERSDGRITVRGFYNQSLLQAGDMLPGVAAGRADIGYLANSYFPAELPLTSVVEVPFTNDDVAAQGRALAELYETDDTYRQEWADQGVHVLYFPALGANVLATREPLDALDDLRGQSIRGLGLVNEALQAVGAGPVAIAAPEIYESVQRGVIDGFSGYAYEVITSQKLHEVAPHITDTGFGEYNASIMVLDLDIYDGLPDDLRQVVDEVSDEASERSVELLVEAEDQTCRTVVDAGGTVTRLSDADIDQWRQSVHESLVDEWTAERGSAEFYERYVELTTQHASDSEYVPGVQRCAAG